MSNNLINLVNKIRTNQFRIYIFKIQTKEKIKMVNINLIFFLGLTYLAKTQFSKKSRQNKKFSKTHKKGFLKLESIIIIIITPS